MKEIQCVRRLLKKALFLLFLPNEIAKNIEFMIENTTGKETKFAIFSTAKAFSEDFHTINESFGIKLEFVLSDVDKTDKDAYYFIQVMFGAAGSMQQRNFV